MALQKGMVSSKSNEWATPQDLFDKLNEEFHFSLDPCATHENKKCSTYYTLDDDGLTKDWTGHSVFMNPPYGGHTKEWIEKAWGESLKGCVVVCLIVASPDRSYWQDIIFPYASQIRFLRGRLKFGGVKNSAPFASAIVIFDKSTPFERFRDYGYRVKFNMKSYSSLKTSTTLV